MSKHFQSRCDLNGSALIGCGDSNDPNICKLHKLRWGEVFSYVAFPWKHLFKCLIMYRLRATH